MKTSTQRGFSLVELMIAVGIIGILATMAMPAIKRFQAKAKQAEAKTNLMHIKTLAEAYFADFSNYGTASVLPFGRLTYDGSGGGCATQNYCNQPNDIGFSVPCQDRHYDYFYFSDPINGYRANAVERLPGAGLCASNRHVFPGCSIPLPDTWRVTGNSPSFDVQGMINQCS